MATNPDTTSQHQAELAAALLLVGRRYSLPTLISNAGVKPRPFRQIKPTEALRSDMAAPYMDLVRAWAAQSPALMAAYRSALASGDLSVIQRQVEASAADVERSLATIERRFPQIVARLEQWHRLQFTARIKAATGIDTAMFASPQDVAVEASNAVAWNEQLIGDVHRQVKGAIVGALAGALAVAAPVAFAQGGVSTALKKAKRRGLNIGVDQVDRTARAFDRARRQAASLDSFIWHHTDQRHPRPEHKARDGRTYSQSNAPNDRAGTLPFCKCWEEPLFS